MARRSVTVMATAPPGCPVHETFDPPGAAFSRGPFAVMDELPLEETPGFYAPSLGYHVVTRHADVERVFLDPPTPAAADRNR